jgi:methylisocitrate lyase
MAGTLPVKGATPRALTGAAKLRELLSDPEKLVVAPGVFDGISARIALGTGFEAIYMVSTQCPT